MSKGVITALDGALAIICLAVAIVFIRDADETMRYFALFWAFMSGRRFTEMLEGLSE